MTIDEAIKILETGLEGDMDVLSQDFDDAQKLGIQALRWVKGSRLSGWAWLEPLLPGETEE